VRRFFLLYCELRISVQHPLVEEPDQLGFLHELAVFESFVGTEFPPFVLLRIIRLVRVLRAGLPRLLESAQALGVELRRGGGGRR